MAPLQKIKNNQGFAFIEGLLCLPLFTFTTFGVFFTGAVLFVQMGLSFEGHQALICLKEEQPFQICQKELKEHAKKWMPLGKIENIQTQGDLEKLSRIHIYWSVKGHRFHVQREIPWKHMLRKKVFLP